MRVDELDEFVEDGLRERLVCWRGSLCVVLQAGVGVLCSVSGGVWVCGYLLYYPLLVHARRKVLEVDCSLDRCSQSGNKPDVHVCFYQRIAYLLDHAVECLRETDVSRLSVASITVVATFSSTVGDRVKSDTAELIRRPRS